MSAASRRDLAETQAFDRRRLAEALVREPGDGAPAPWRPVLVGLGLALLLVAGAAAAAVLA